MNAVSKNQSEKTFWLVFCVVVYGLLLCFSRFYGVFAAANVPLFNLAADPSLYPGDMYAHNSVMTKTTYMYNLLAFFGPLIANTYFIFLLYVVVHLAHIYFIYKIAEVLFPHLKEHSVGLIALFMFLYDHPIFTGGAYHQLVSIQSFRQTTMNTPLIAASIYYFLKNRYILSVFILSILAIPLHFRSSWIFAVIILFYMAIETCRGRIKYKEIFGCLVLFAISAAILWWYKTQCGISEHLDFQQKLSLYEVVKERYLDEGTIMMSSTLDLVRLFVFIIPAVICIKFLKDQQHRMKLTIFYAIAFFFFAVGILYTSVFYKSYPSLEIFSLGFPQLVNYPIIIGFVLLGGRLLELTLQNDKKKAAVALFLLFALAYFPNFKIKSIPIYLVSIIVGYLVVRYKPSIPKKMGLKPLAACFFITVSLFLCVKDSERIYQAYKGRSVDFPFMIFLFDRDSYEAQMWVKKNTSPDSVILPFRSYSAPLGFDDFFRKYSGRTLLLGDVANVMQDYSLVQEHLKREKFFKSIREAIMLKDSSVLKELFSSHPWRVDYIVLPTGFTIDNERVYANESFSVYHIKSLK